MKVTELIDKLKEYDGELEVAYNLCGSETYYTFPLEADCMDVVKLSAFELPGELREDADGDDYLLIG